MRGKGRFRRFGHVLQKDDTDWFKWCTEMEVERVKQRRRLRKHGVEEVVKSVSLSQEDTQVHN